MKYNYVFVAMISICFIAVPVRAQETKEQQAAADKNIQQPSLEQILEEEKAQKHKKIDDFLESFDKGYDKASHESLQDLLKNDNGAVDQDEEQIDTDSFEEFNEAFDKMIEKDIADFDLIDIDAENLESGLNITEENTIDQKEATEKTDSAAEEPS